jgi:diguanylate cyclase (GGDEF)-like protein
MSLYKQLWLTILFSILLALVGSLLGSLWYARCYLEEQLSMKNHDNATALALSLSQQQLDGVTVELTVSALFDSGHYQSIEFHDPEGASMIQRSTPEQVTAAPAWFTRLLPIVATPGQAQVTDGWTQFGTITLESNSDFAYGSLWHSALQMAAAALLAGLVGLYLGTRVLTNLRRPLDTLVQQATAIMERRFITSAEPKVPELHQLGAAMNSMVQRVRDMFDEEARNLEKLRLEANHDALTGLANRAYLLGRLRAALQSDDAGGASLLLLRLHDLADINRSLGRAATDDLLRRVGKVLQAHQTQGEGLAGRLNGADFALLVPDAVPLRELATRLLAELQQETAGFGDNAPRFCCGIGTFAPGVEPATAMAQTDAALATAEADPQHGVHEAQGANADSALGSEAWARLMSEALTRQRVRLGSFSVISATGALLHHESPLRMQIEENGEWLPAGRFLPMAERLRMTAALDLAVARLGLEALGADPGLGGIAVNLSAASLADAGFLPALTTLLRQAGTAASQRLWLEVPETGALQQLPALKALLQVAKSVGSKVGIEHCGRQFSQIGQLHQLGLDYLKIDASFVRDVQDHAGNQAFLRGLTMIARSIGLLVIAEGVTQDAEWACLKQLGFDGATGPLIR